MNHRDSRTTRKYIKTPTKHYVKVAPPTISLCPLPAFCAGNVVGRHHEAYRRVYDWDFEIRLVEMSLRVKRIYAGELTSSPGQSECLYELVLLQRDNS